MYYLGLWGKLMTGPWMMLVYGDETKREHLAMSPHFQRALKFCRYITVLKRIECPHESLFQTLFMLMHNMALHKWKPCAVCSNKHHLAPSSCVSFVSISSWWQRWDRQVPVKSCRKIVKPVKETIQNQNKINLSTPQLSLKLRNQIPYRHTYYR